MLAVLLALAAAAGYGGSDYAAGLAARRASVVRVTVLAEVTSAALLLCVVPFISSQTPSLASVLWGIAAGASGVAGAMALYLGFRHAAFSVASSVSAVGSAAFSVLAGVVLGEQPGALSLAGIALGSLLSRTLCSRASSDLTRLLRSISVLVLLANLLGFADALSARTAG